ncbi:hypothetical protein CALCODRAFT_228943 [Calocera cornea HHB12733]|uniref:Uncharacterized protein n=1 Tax=Calocera cornea HHB12733 TaxID=1353952 RepID=A0A165H3T9_9BASI|nr:hypothetical protein CALCODRAFT_228943 [Calocera cornea HHB12733]
MNDASSYYYVQRRVVSAHLGAQCTGNQQPQSSDRPRQPEPLEPPRIVPRRRGEVGADLLALGIQQPHPPHIRDPEQLGHAHPVLHREVAVRRAERAPFLRRAVHVCQLHLLQVRVRPQPAERLEDREHGLAVLAQEGGAVLARVVEELAEDDAPERADGLAEVRGDVVHACVREVEGERAEGRAELDEGEDMPVARAGGRACEGEGGDGTPGAEEHWKHFGVHERVVVVHAAPLVQVQAEVPQVGQLEHAEQTGEAQRLVRRLKVLHLPDQHAQGERAREEDRGDVPQGQGAPEAAPRVIGLLGRGCVVPWAAEVQVLEPRAVQQEVDDVIEPLRDGGAQDDSLERAAAVGDQVGAERRVGESGRHPDELFQLRTALQHPRDGRLLAAVQVFKSLHNFGMRDASSDFESLGPAPDLTVPTHPDDRFRDALHLVLLIDDDPLQAERMQHPAPSSADRCKVAQVGHGLQAIFICLGDVVAIRAVEVEALHLQRVLEHVRALGLRRISQYFAPDLDRTSCQRRAHGEVLDHPRMCRCRGDERAAKVSGRPFQARADDHLKRPETWSSHLPAIIASQPHVYAGTRHLRQPRL